MGSCGVSKACVCVWGGVVSENGDVGSRDVTLGCAANSAGTFFYTLQWIKDTLTPNATTTHTHTQFPTPSLSVIHFKNLSLWV